MTSQHNAQVCVRLCARVEAAAWVVKLHGPGRNANLEAAWREWMAEDPTHQEAWELASDVWTETCEPTEPVIPPHRPALNVRWAGLVAAVVLASLLMVVGAIYAHQDRSIATLIGEQRTIVLSDGTSVELNTDSRVRVQFDHQMRRVVLERGEAYFKVAHERRPFTVVAGERQIMALGTAFTVRRDPSSDDAVTVTLLEGRVAVTAPPADERSTRQTHSADTILNAGQRLRAHRHAQAAVDAPAMDKVTGWMRGRLMFDHTPLSAALAEFGRYNKVKITVASPEAAAIQVGGIFKIGDAESFARAVAASYNLTVIAHGDELVLAPAPRESDTPPNPAVSE